jgi:predicted MFS family arabinose efflux permease
MRNLKPTKIIFLTMFFYAVHIGMTAYVNSSFAEGLGLSNMHVSLVYIAGALITILSLFIVPRLTNKIGNRKTLITLFSLVIVSLLCFIHSSSIFLVIPFLALYLGMHSVILFELDVLLEHFSDESLTGQIRGAFLTVLNIAWTISPFLAGYILDQSGFQNIYIIGLAATILVAIVIAGSFKKQSINKTHIQTPREAFHTITKNKDLFGVFSLSTLLQYFYAVMIIFSPIYLNTIGFSWTEIGLIFALMHIPFLLLEYPLGRLADKYIGEKEIMIIGLVVMAIACLGFLYTTEPAFMIWAGIFIISRIGASFLETGTETYFFKKVEHDDVEIISSFRNASPVAIILGSLTGFLINFTGIDLQYVFVATSLLLLAGILPALRINDTR